MPSYVRMLVGPKQGLTIEMEDEAATNLIKREHAESSTKEAFEADAEKDRLVAVEEKDLGAAPENKMRGVNTNKGNSKKAKKRSRK